MTNEKKKIFTKVTIRFLFLLWCGFLFVCLLVWGCFCGEAHREWNSGLCTYVTEICHLPLFYLFFSSLGYASFPRYF